MKKLRVLSIVLLVALIVEAVPANAASVNDFTDVPVSAWYYDYVKTAVGLGLINGATATTFAPNATMTRGQFVTVLGRYEGVTDSANTGVFTDVRADMYYAVYVYWAYANGIVTGTGPTAFSPDANLTREQMAALIVRYADSKGIAIPAVGGDSAFKDADKISGYAKPAVEALKKAGIMTGDNNGNCNPQAAITRAEATALFVRFLTVAGLIGGTGETEIDCTAINSYATGNSTLAEGDTVQIRTEFVPENTTIDRTLTYNSTNPAVATVSATGLVRAVGTGTAHIQVTSSNGHMSVITVKVRDVNAKAVDFELESYDWTVYTATDASGAGYFFFTEDIVGEPVITQEKNIATSRSFTMFSPYIVFEDGYRTTRSTDYISIYGMTYTSSNPDLLTANADATITVNRALSASESPQTVTITAYSKVLNVSHTAKVTIYRQSLYEYNDSYTQAFNKEVVRLVNAERAARGLSPLSYDASMLAGAVTRAKELSADFNSTMSAALFPGKQGLREASFRNLDSHASFYSPEHLAQCVVNTFLTSTSGKDKILLDSNAANSAMGVSFTTGGKSFFGAFVTASK